ncbi:MAG: filamentous hemagglutinin N-terminal domain-containing protein, partial [Gammaproteobacteria bacterium]
QCILAMEVVAQPLMPDGSTQTSLDQAPNGVPIINIARPGASGLSHNRYRDFNIDPQGLIFNNAATSVATTQLGGLIVGNPNLQRSATLILNEITGTQPSQLKGYGEIAGQAADLVIANPNGLTINGTGFINTSRLVLTTGRPVLSAGNLDHFSIDTGEILVEGQGLNALDTPVADLFSRYMTLNSKIHAHSLHLSLGSQNIDYTTNQAQFQSGSVVSTKSLLLDSTSLGGLYADSIHLVGTEAGLGVNMPPEVLASNGSIQIEQQGNLTLYSAQATQDIQVNSGGTQTIIGDISSGRSLALLSSSTLDTGSGMLSGGVQVSLQAGTLNQTATILSGKGNSNGPSVPGNLQVVAQDINNSGILAVTGDVTLTTQNLNNQGTLFAGKNMHLFTRGSLTNNNGAEILAMQDMLLAA